MAERTTPDVRVDGVSAGRAHKLDLRTGAGVTYTVVEDDDGVRVTYSTAGGAHPDLATHDTLGLAVEKTRGASDGLPSTADGAKWIEIPGAAAGDAFHLSFYQFGALLAVKHPSEQLETWLWDYSAAGGAGAWIPVTTTRMNGDSTEFQIRNRTDTDGLAFEFPATGSVKITSATTGLQIQPAGGIGFFGATPSARPTITGTRDANPAVATLLTQLAALGLITDSTTAGTAPHPDLATHDTLGLATQTELDTHAAAADPHAGYRLETADHTHATTGLQAGKLAQVNTHETPDTDTGPTSLHHTIGAGANQASAGNHSHAGAGHTIADAGVAETQRGTLDFQDGFIVTDNAGANSTDVDLDFGTGATQAAAGNHAHTNDHARLHSIIGASDHNGFPGGTTNFLRADGTFAAPPGGGGAWTTVIKTADEARTSTATVADDATLQFTTVANTQYVFKLRVWLTTNTTADSKCRVVHTGTTTRVARRVFRTASTDTALTFQRLTAFDAADIILSTTGSNPYYEEYTVLRVGATGGLVKFQWSQVTSDVGATTVLEGSHIEYATS